jgi:hypothetical protein
LTKCLAFQAYWTWQVECLHKQWHSMRDPPNEGIAGWMSLLFTYTVYI